MKLYTPPKTIDIPLPRLLAAMHLRARDDKTLTIERIIRKKTHQYSFIGHSVRSIFMTQLLIERKNRDSVIFTGITLNEMSVIASSCGYSVDSVDIDFHTQKPNLSELRKLLKKNPKAIVVFTPLFGAIVDYKQAIKVSREAGAHIIIDNAQGFRGLNNTDYSGYDLMLYSFGSIKTATALGGAIALSSDESIIDGLRNQSKNYKKDSHVVFYKKAIKYVGLIIASKPIMFSLLVLYSKVFNIQLELLLSSSTRGYDSDPTLKKFEKLPSYATTYLLSESLSTTSQATLLPRICFGQKIATTQSHRTFGTDTKDHSHWLLPFVVENPANFKNRLHKAGYIATTQGSSMSVVSKRHIKLHESLNSFVYVPNGPMSAKKQKKLIDLVKQHD